jgi:hypothetical protein
MNFEDILYEVRNGVAWIIINRATQQLSAVIRDSKISVD